MEQLYGKEKIRYLTPCRICSFSDAFLTESGLYDSVGVQAACLKKQLTAEN